MQSLDFTMESAAVSVLKRAVEMDKEEKFTMALVLYQEGVQILLDAVKGTMYTIFLCFSFFLFSRARAKQLTLSCIKPSLQWQ